MPNGLRFRDLKSVPDTMKAAVQRALARDDAMAAGRAQKRKREPKASMADALAPFHSVSREIGQDGAVFTIDLAMRSERGLNNSRGVHWSKTAKRVKSEKTAAHIATTDALRGFRVPSATVTLTRRAPGSGLDDDNLTGSMKAFRDGVAAAIGIDDADKRVQYRYAQERVGCSGWGVRIEIRCPNTENP